MKFRWEVDEAMYGAGQKCFLGQCWVGGYKWDGTSKSQRNKLKPYCRLPAKWNLENQAGAGEARVVVEHAVERWIDHTGILDDAITGDPTMEEMEQDAQRAREAKHTLKLRLDTVQNVEVPALEAEVERWKAANLELRGQLARLLAEREGHGQALQRMRERVNVAEFDRDYAAKIRDENEANRAAAQTDLDAANEAMDDLFAEIREERLKVQERDATIARKDRIIEGQRAALAAQKGKGETTDAGTDPTEPGRTPESLIRATSWGEWSGSKHRLTTATTPSTSPWSRAGPTVGRGGRRCCDAPRSGTGTCTRRTSWPHGWGGRTPQPKGWRDAREARCRARTGGTGGGRHPGGVREVRPEDLYPPVRHPGLHRGVDRVRDGRAVPGTGPRNRGGVGSEEEHDPWETATRGLELDRDEAVMMFGVTRSGGHRPPRTKPHRRCAAMRRPTGEVDLHKGADPMSENVEGSSKAAVEGRTSPRAALAAQLVPSEGRARGPRTGGGRGGCRGAAGRTVRPWRVHHRVREPGLRGRVHGVGHGRVRRWQDAERTVPVVEGHRGDGPAGAGDDPGGKRPDVPADTHGGAEADGMGCGAGAAALRGRGDRVLDVTASQHSARGHEGKNRRGGRRNQVQEGPGGGNGRRRGKVLDIEFFRARRNCRKARTEWTRCALVRHGRRQSGSPAG